MSTTNEIVDRVGNGSAPDGADAIDLALDRLAAAIDELHALDWTAYADQRIEDGLRRFVAETRCLSGVRNGLVAEAIDRCLPRLRRAGSPAMYLRDLVHVSLAEGRAWERDAIELVPRRSLSGGELLPPCYPIVALAINAGAISTAHAREITGTLRRAPSTVGLDELVRAELRLVEYARKHDPAALRRRCEEIAEELDPDGSLGSTPEERERARSFRIGRQDRNGMYSVTGRLDPEVGAMVAAALSPLAAPQPGLDGKKDPRTAEQRNHDALGELARRALAHGDLPVRHGLPGKLIVTIRLEQLEKRTGTGSTIHGGRLPVRDLLRLAAELGVIPVVLDSNDRILHYGAEQRLATEDQRLAMWIMDGGCTFEGCSVPAAWCQSAHGEPFQTSRKTTIDDMGLLCGYHHRMVDNHGYEIQRTNNRVWFTPPKWVDPDQTPRTNEHFRPLRQ